MCAKRLSINHARKTSGFMTPVWFVATVRMLVLFGASLAIWAATIPSSIAGVSGNTPWAVIKCKFSDQPQEPTFDPAFITGANGMAGYWQAVSYGQVSLNGSAVYGWYTLPITLAQAQMMSRSQKIDACIAAATDVDFSKYYNVIAVLNTKSDSGADGVGGRVLLDPYAWTVTFAAHEMGHGYGLEHSWSANPDTEYGDPWDIMSAMSVYRFQAIYGRDDDLYRRSAGPGLDAPNLDKLGWMPANRVLTWDGTSETVTIAALNRPLVAGYLMVKVPFDAANPNHYYTIEFRRKTDWDQAIPQDTVLIHEVRTNGLSYLISASGGPQLLPGQTFNDLANNVAITVLNTYSVAQTATINIGRNEVWVDFAYPGLPFFPEVGSFDAPYNTVAEGVSHVAYGGVLNFKTGSSSERPTINTRMTLKAYNGPVTIGR